MKKSVSLLLSLLMIVGVVCVGYTVAAEGNVYTVGATVEEADFISGGWIPGTRNGAYLPVPDACIQSDRA